MDQDIEINVEVEAKPVWGGVRGKSRRGGLYFHWTKLTCMYLDKNN